MNIPNIFIPEENFDEKIESLKKEKAKLDPTKTLSDCLMYQTWFDHKENYKNTIKRYSSFDL